MDEYRKNPLDYVPGRGIVEVRYGIENEVIELRHDLYDYVRQELNNGKDRFPKDFTLKDKATGKRYWFACLVCPCDLSSPVTMVAHIHGQKHQKKAIAKLAEDNNPPRSSLPFSSAPSRGHSSRPFQSGHNPRSSYPR